MMPSDWNGHELRVYLADKFEESAMQFENYATIQIENSEAKMREIASTTQGYVPRYTPVELVLLEQLGRKRKDRTIQEVAKAAGDPELRDMMKQFMALQIEEKKSLIDRESRVSQVPVDDKTMMAAPPAEREGHGITNDAPEGQEAMAEAFQDAVPVETDGPSFECDCEFTAKSLAGLKAHQRNCKLTKEV